MAMTNSAAEPLSLGRVVLAVKDWVGRLGEVWVDAQVIEIKRRNAPTQFLTLRDRTQEISASVTASRLVLDTAGPLPEGSRVTARLKPRVWEKNGSLSFECLELRPAGEGQLLAQIERLKRKLQAEGLFDPARKRPLPFLPNRIGLITGKDSDAERDVLTHINRRWPRPISTVHALVQGPQSAESVMRAIETLAADEEVDVIIIARGGGSLEDLLSFSDEGVVRAAATCATPIISAIGHEQDSPLLDLVADARASTPTDAGRLVAPDAQEESDRLAVGVERLGAAIDQRLATEQQRLAELLNRPVLRDPASAFAGHDDRLGLLRHRLDAAIAAELQAQAAWLGSALSSVRAMSPRATLQRGYAILVDSAGNSVSSITATKTGDSLDAFLADGSLGLTVNHTKPRENHE